ncbi:hypothetical protein SAMN02745866_03351 [Alteromonadaceae bacterium Bs31]|nr:hypothetical protein SAMN02745866_03351 [Alteromonadaceae bacterium Bs31]
MDEELVEDELVDEELLLEDVSPSEGEPLLELEVLVEDELVLEDELLEGDSPPAGVPLLELELLLEEELVLVDEPSLEGGRNPSSSRLPPPQPLMAALNSTTGRIELIRYVGLLIILFSGLIRYIG